MHAEAQSPWMQDRPPFTFRAGVAVELAASTPGRRRHRMELRRHHSVRSFLAVTGYARLEMVRQRRTPGAEPLVQLLGQLSTRPRAAWRCRGAAPTDRVSRSSARGRARTAAGPSADSGM